MLWCHQRDFCSEHDEERQIYLCMGVQKAVLTFTLYLYPFHAVIKRETTGRIVSRALSSTYTSPEHNTERYRYNTGYISIDM
jgi:hypothetical protein